MKKLFPILLFVFVISCKNYQNEYIEWSQNIKEGSSISEVKKSQPNFVKINWETPDTINDSLLWFHIEEIKGNNDFMNMDYILEFENGKFKGTFAHK